MPIRILLIYLVILLSACTPQEPELQNFSGMVLGTNIQISYWAKQPIATDDIDHALVESLEYIEKVLAHDKADSEIELFNAKNSSENVMVSNDIVELIRVSKDIYQLSQGCFDLSIKPLFALWGFDTDTFTIPSPEAISETLTQVGMDKLEIINDTHIRKSIGSIQMDVSNLAKSYSVNKVAKVLQQFEIDNYRIDIGGQYKTHGQLPNGSSWRVSVDRPLPGERHLHKVIIMPKEAAMSVMTASSYRFFFDAYGQRYSHVLDVRTGKPITHNLLAVLVFHENPILAEAWANALLCLGPQTGSQLANAQNLHVFFVKQQGSELLETQSIPLRDSTNISVE